ncbi:antitoxin component YwqK of YwqJK toxin-antitoxin module [Tenacibaculum lutimaris]|uniref:Antitoxin component YwqK of YwqJK toxin-antitoxin module n=1 Tax=Tenacibaculum lutimaris TaxID=285258 RepID=A0A420E271_9FLAO|nr:hypothetical protein [Tenacibaculum lutimaris]RKF04003.1 antitoxin component YwqK of YwqJK toxin-antitoxin module [Tenacibaculum lutimaris]
MNRLKILLIGCLTITSQIVAQNLVMQNDIVEQQFGKQILYKDSNNNLLNGYYKIADNRGNFIDAHFKNGTKEGIQTNYDYKERKLSEKSFKNGKTHGKYKRFHQNGQVNVQGEFVNGNQEGKWEYFNDKGEIEVREFYKSGKAEGKWWKKVRTNSNIASFITENYKNGEHYGRSEQKDADGKIEWERKYTNDGSYWHKSYYSNGKPEIEKNLKDYKLDGVQKTWNQNGILLSMKTFSKDQIQQEIYYYKNGHKDQVHNYSYGKKEDLFERYTEKGIKLEVGYYKHGFKTGVWKNFDSETGRLITERTYENNVLNGIYKSYNEANKVSTEGSYKNGEQDGIWKHYNLAGKLIQETEYQIGKEISEKKYK